MKSRNKTQGRYCGKLNGIHCRAFDKRFGKTLGWEWVMLVAADDYIRALLDYNGTEP